MDAWLWSCKSEAGNLAVTGPHPALLTAPECQSRKQYTLTLRASSISFMPMVTPKAGISSNAP